MTAPDFHLTIPGVNVDGPHDVPALRSWLLDRWRPGGVLELMARHNRALMHPRDRNVQWTETEEGHWQRGHLADAKLWWVSAQMVDEISHVAANMPADVKPTDVPGLVVEHGPGYASTGRGLVVLEKPILGTDAFNGKDGVAVDGFVYGTTRLPPMRGVDADTNAVYAIDSRHGVGFASYRKVPAGEYGMATPHGDLMLTGPDHHLMAGLMAAELQLAQKLPGGAKWATGYGFDYVRTSYDTWCPLGRSDWPLFDQLNQKIEPSLHPQAQASMEEDRRWLAALFLVAADKLTTEVTEEEPTDRRKRATSRRKGLPTKVHVVYLRRPTRTTRQGAAEGRQGVRGHVVRSHPRWQACGPQMADRRLITVPRHSRGNPDDPMPGGGGTVTAVVR